MNHNQSLLLLLPIETEVLNHIFINCSNATEIWRHIMDHVHLQTASQGLNFNAWLLWNLNRKISAGGGFGDGGMTRFSITMS